ncbi:MAG: hypothetical protein ABFD91_17125 [Anaerohalosphaeraceae bacterium]
MQKTPTTNKWQYFIILFLIGVGVLIGTLTASGIYNAGRGWLAALFVGLFCGCLGMVGIHLFLQGILICFGTTSHLRHTKEKMWGVIPVWMPFGIYGLLMFGGVILSVIGRITKSHICSSIGDLALTIALGTIGVLAVIGLSLLGWKKISKLRKTD